MGSKYTNFGDDEDAFSAAHPGPVPQPNPRRPPVKIDRRTPEQAQADDAALAKANAAKSSYEGARAADEGKFAPAAQVMRSLGLRK